MTSLSDALLPVFLASLNIEANIWCLTDGQMAHQRIRSSARRGRHSQRRKHTLLIYNELLEDLIKCETGRRTDREPSLFSKKKTLLCALPAARALFSCLFAPRRLKTECSCQKDGGAVARNVAKV